MLNEEDERAWAEDRLLLRHAQGALEDLLDISALLVGSISKTVHDIDRRVDYANWVIKAINGEEIDE